MTQIKKIFADFYFVYLRKSAFYLCHLRANQKSKMYKIILTICISFFCLFAEAHSGKARFHVIIDTDGAADDLRAICMLLSNLEVETLSITISEGVLTPADAAQKVTALLHHFYHEGIPVGVCHTLNIKNLIIQTIEEENEKVIFICFGTLTNLNDVLTTKPVLKERIERVIWYNSSANPLRGANYEADRTSADKVLASGVRVDIVSGEGTQEIVIDGQYLKMWDDLAVVYLFAPELFTSTNIRENVSMYSLANADAAGKVKDVAIQILGGKPDNESRVFFGFPDDPALYAADVAPVVKNIIARHGRSEWRAGVLTNELHGHLGIYAIIGVKMGIRAREFFNIGVDDITVVTYAGLQPPISCMNDGLQVSTGGTLGHGLISVADEKIIRPEATFTFKNKTLRLKLKPEYAQQIRKDVEDAIRQYGNLTEPYWQQIRLLAIKYWEEFDRHEMFEMSW